MSFQKRKVEFGKTYRTKQGNLFTPVSFEKGDIKVFSINYQSRNAREMGRYIDKDGNRLKACNLIKIPIEPRPILILYKLLFDQIKNEDITSIRPYIINLRNDKLISIEEMLIIDRHLFENKAENELSKNFIQHFIENN